MNKFIKVVLLFGSKKDSILHNPVILNVDKVRAIR